MSKERELLMRWLSGEANEMTTHIPLLIETQNLLAQPEQKPVAWMYDWKTSIEYDGKVQHVVTNKNFLTLKINHALNEVENIRPLYTSPQTCDVVKLQNEVYQYRHKLPEDAFWSQWIECEIDYYKTYLSAPIKANIYGTLIEYQVRVLHKEPPTREPLSDSDIRTHTPFHYHDAEQKAFAVGVRWAEAQHGITGVADE